MNDSRRPIAALRSAWQVPRRGACWIRDRLGRAGHPPPPWEADVLDDLAFNRPWNLLVKVARARAQLRLARLRTAETLVIVNWNTLPVLHDTLRAVRALSPADLEILVVDNGSTDGSRAWLKDQDDLRLLALPANIGHAIALDLGVLSARTDVVVTLDSDAVPLTAGWLERVVEPVRRPDVVLAGLRSSRDFVHPVFSAVRVRPFVERQLSFQVHRLPDVDDRNRIWGQNCWDTGELMTRRLADHEVVFVDPTPNRVDGLPGMTTGGVVYHHGGVTRSGDGGLTSGDLSEWRAALDELLPPVARPLAAEGRS